MSGSIGLEHRHEYYQKNPRALIVGIGFAIGSSVLGLYLTGWVGFLIGIFIGLVSLWVIPSLKTKIVEKMRTRSE
jgi:ABC-type amino acid transport system permease subunit